jgi:hypothetical protein
MNALLTPPVRFVVPKNTSNAPFLGMGTVATEIAGTKLPSIPRFCRVLSNPEMLPNEPALALAMMALLLAGKNMEVPKSEMAKPISTM